MSEFDFSVKYTIIFLPSIDRSTFGQGHRELGSTFHLHDPLALQCFNFHRHFTTIASSTTYQEKKIIPILKTKSLLPRKSWKFQGLTEEFEPETYLKLAS